MVPKGGGGGGGEQVVQPVVLYGDFALAAKQNLLGTVCSLIISKWKFHYV